MKIFSFCQGAYASNCYLVTDDAQTTAVVIDPSVSYEVVQALYGSPLPPVTQILLTHAHFDHVLALDDWRAKTHAPLALHQAEAVALSNPTYNCGHLFLGHDMTFAPAERLLVSGDRIPVGTEYLTVMHTPGHTKGSCIFLADDFAVTGDTVFADGGYGRCDLPGGNEREIAASIRAFFALAGERKLYAGHGAPTTTSLEKRFYNL